MIKLDDLLLGELGLHGLPPSHRRALLQMMYQELEIRVGYSLSRAMTDDQLARFGRFIEANDEAAAREFLEREYPTYRDVVAGEFAHLKAEITAYREEIRALSNAYLDVQIELPPHANPWTRRQEKADSRSPGL